MEDLDDRAAADVGRRQLADLAAIGVTWDAPVQWQSAQRARYEEVIDELVADGLAYECYCSRKDIVNAPQAPHSPPSAYPGTCRNLSESQRAERRRQIARPPALRLRAAARTYTVTDVLHGEYTGVVDDFVLRRGDGIPSYNLAVVIDDAASGIDQVTRGDDLLSSAPRQAYLANLLGYPEPTYAHVPLVLDAAGKRLAKRDKALTLREIDAETVSTQIHVSLGWSVSTPFEILDRFDPKQLPREPWTYVQTR